MENRHLDIYELQEFKKKLSKYEKKEPKELIRILGLLKKIRVTPDLLQKSQITSIISKLAKNKSKKVNKEVQECAGDLRAIWKRQLSDPSDIPNKQAVARDGAENDEDEKLFEKEPWKLQENKKKHAFQAMLVG